MSVDRDGRLFVVSAVGRYPAADMKQALDDIMALPDFPADALLLVDMSRADSVLQHSVGELKDVARHFLATHRRSRAEWPCSWPAWLATG